MAGRSQGDPVNRRLRQLGAESERVRSEIRRLNAHMDAPSRSGRGDTQTGDLFAWAAKQRKFERAGSLSLRRRPQRGGSVLTSAGSSSRGRDPRLITYLTSGSFGRLTPIRDEDDVPRNRVVFVLLVGLAVAYVVYRIASH